MKLRRSRSNQIAPEEHAALEKKLSLDFIQVDGNPSKRAPVKVINTKNLENMDKVCGRGSLYINISGS